MASKQTKHWYDRVERVEKIGRQAWRSQRTARKLEQYSREGFQLVNVTNDLYSFLRTKPAERKYFVLSMNGYNKNRRLTGEWYEKLEPYIVEVINHEGWRLIAEVDAEKLDLDYYFLVVKKMKKAMQIPAFFVIYSLVWGFMIAINDWNILIRCIIGLTALGAFCYGLYSLLVCFREIARTKRDMMDCV